MKHLENNASNEEIINKVNEIIDYILQWRVSMLEDEIRRIQYRTAQDEIFKDKILPIIGGKNGIQ